MELATSMGSSLGYGRSSLKLSNGPSRDSPFRMYARARVSITLGSNVDRGTGSLQVLYSQTTSLASDGVHVSYNFGTPKSSKG